MRPSPKRSQCLTLTLFFDLEAVNSLEVGVVGGQWHAVLQRGCGDPDVVLWDHGSAGGEVCPDAAIELGSAEVRG